MDWENVSVKPWPNGVASNRKLKTCVNLWLCLAMTCVYLRRLAMTWVHFDGAQICTQVNASFSPFGHPTQVVASWSQYCFPLYGACARLHWNGFLATCTELASTCESIWPLIATVFASSLFLTCVDLRLRLVRALYQGFVTLGFFSIHVHFTITGLKTFVRYTEDFVI